MKSYASVPLRKMKKFIKKRKKVVKSREYKNLGQKRIRLKHMKVHNVHNVHNTRDKHAPGKLLTITVHNVHNLLFS